MIEIISFITRLKQNRVNECFKHNDLVTNRKCTCYFIDSNDLVNYLLTGIDKKMNNQNKKNNYLLFVSILMTTTYCEKQQPKVTINFQKILEPVLDYGENTLQAITNITNNVVNEPLADNVARSNEAKIVGGSSTNVKRWPWMAGLLRKGKSVPFCGGSLVNQNTIVTAGHCVAKENPRSLRIRLGSSEMRSGKREAHSKEYAVRSMRTHPGYHYPHNDIAVIKLKSKVKYNKYIQPIALDSGDGEHSGRSVVVTGWGTTSYGGRQSRKLKEVGLKVWDLSSCNRAIKDFPITNGMICAGDPNGQRKDACQGDSGGPLMTHSGNKWKLIGIVSFGDKCGKPNMPGVYTRVSKYSGWVRSQG